jgi:hypothetical protein
MTLISGIHFPMNHEEPTKPAAISAAEAAGSAAAKSALKVLAGCVGTYPGCAIPLVSLTQGAWQLFRTQLQHRNGPRPGDKKSGLPSALPGSLVSTTGNPDLHATVNDSANPGPL